MSKKSKDDDQSKRLRSQKAESQSENPTLKRLAGTPFKTASEMNEAEGKILKEAWEALAKAKAFDSLTEKENFTFFRKIFERGMRCRYGQGSEDIVKVNLKNGELIVEINEEMKSQEHSEKFVASLAQALSDSFFSNYLKAMRILPIVDLAEKAKDKNQMQDLA